MQPNPHDYDIIHLGISGGKDSTAVMLWLIYQSGWPLHKVRITCCDTGNEDHFTYVYLAMLAERVHPIEYIFPERDFWELARWKKRFPSRRARFCTQWLKIIPSREYILNLMRDGANVLLLNGVRSAEGRAHNDRGDLPRFGWDEGFGCDIYRPILDWCLDDVWAIHMRYLYLDDVFFLIRDDPYLPIDLKKELISNVATHGIPRNPLYDMGALRVGCFPCINSAKMEIRAMGKYRPRRIDFIETQEGSFNNANMYSTMFARNTVPEAHRSKEIITASGETMKVATIRDVVEWSKTAYGGKQYEMDLDIPKASTCDIGGLCE